MKNAPEFTHIEVISVGAYGSYMKVGQLLKVVTHGDRFFYVESFDKKATFKISTVTKRACGRDCHFIRTHKQPKFDF